jgi:hypothetical protein
VLLGEGMDSHHNQAMDSQDTSNNQDILEDIVMVRFIGGGNQRTQRKAQTSRKSLTKFIT